MNNTDNDRRLDSFESALLAELRQVVTENRAATVRRRPRFVLPTALGGVVAAAIAGVLALTMLGGSPAYAIEETDGGDIVLTIHDLKDSEQLERDLAAHGITAEVSYDPELVDEDGNISISDGSGAADLGEIPDDAQVEVAEEAAEKAVQEYAAGGGETVGEEDPSGEGAVLGWGSHEGELPEGELSEGWADPCGFGNGGSIRPVKDGDDYVITIPADSVLRKHTLRITTAETNGALALAASFSPADGTTCGEVTMTE